MSMLSPTATLLRRRKGSRNTPAIFEDEKENGGTPSPRGAHLKRKAVFEEDFPPLGRLLSPKTHNISAQKKAMTPKNAGMTNYSFLDAVLETPKAPKEKRDKDEKPPTSKRRRRHSSSGHVKEGFATPKQHVDYRSKYEKLKMEHEKLSSKMDALMSRLNGQTEHDEEDCHHSRRQTRVKAEESVSRLFSRVDAMERDHTRLSADLQQRTDEVYALMDAKETLGKELTDVKREFFFSAAIAVKLGIDPDQSTKTVPLQELYTQALEQRIPYVEWPLWIANSIVANCEGQ